MSSEQYAFIHKNAVPTREEWQSAIDAAGFDLQLDPELRPFEDSGFSPCRLFGSGTGFEIYYDGSRETIDEFSEISDGRDFCISFRWGASFAEGAAAMIASYVLAASFGAIVSYEGDDPEDLTTLLAQTIAMLEEVKSRS